MGQLPKIPDTDWAGARSVVRRGFQKIESTLFGKSAEVTHAEMTLTGLTASRLTATDSSKMLVSVSNLASWVAGTANEINIANDGDGTITIGIVDPLIVGKGGTGIATLTDHGILLGSGTGAITPLAAATDGQLPIGSTGADPVLAAITQGTGITVTNAAGSITIATTITQYTDEMAQDAVGGVLDDGTVGNIVFTYDDEGGVISAVTQDGEIDHDALTNFVANEHINHTGVTLTAGTGLTGGGDISANRTFAVDGVLEDLDTLGAAASDGQFIVATGAGVFAYESGDTARISLGVGTTDSPQFTAVTAQATISGNIVQYSAINLSEDSGSSAGAFFKTGTQSGFHFYKYGPNGFGGIPANVNAVVFNNYDSANLTFSTGNFTNALTLTTTKAGVGTITPVSMWTVEGALTLKEQAAADADTAAYGQLWVKTATPNELWFTNDAGTDVQLGIAASLVGTHESTYNHGNYNTAYSHSQLTSGNPHSVTKTEVGLGSVENTTLSTWAGSSNITTLGIISTVGNITIANGGTIGQTAGPLLTFDDTNNYLELTGANFGIATTTPLSLLQIGEPTTANSVYNIGTRLRIHGSLAQSETDEVLLRLNRGEGSGQYYPATIDFKLDAYQAGGAGASYNPASRLIIALKSDSNFNEGANSDIVSVLADGRVGVNTNSPLTSLDVRGDASTIGTTGIASNGIFTIYCENTTGSFAWGALFNSPYTFWLQTHDPDSNYYPLSLNPLGGNVGIGDSNPNELLDVDGNINCTGVYKVDDVQVVSSQGAAVADATGAGDVVAQLNALLARCRSHGLITT